MDFELDEIRPKPNPWFEETIEYEGEGQAEFSDPPGIVEGKVRVAFRRNGDSSIRMEVEKTQAERELKFGLTELWSGETPIYKDGKWEISIGARQNPCKRLVVYDSEGVFTAEGKAFTGYSPSWSEEKGLKETLTFQFVHSQFDVKNAGRVKYWVMPLLNFVSEFSQKHPCLDRHPLRLYPTPEVPKGLSDKDELIAQITANSLNRLVVFIFRGEAGFIEALPDYSARKDGLLSGGAREVVTALMVGGAVSPASDISDLQEWFPFGFLDLLSLATGQEVGAPWIELRDEDGKLVRRIHSKSGSLSSKKGKPIFDEVIHVATGKLLTCSTMSDDFGESYLGSAIRHIVRSNLHGNSIEDCMTHICRGFEAVCTHYGIKTQDLGVDLEDSQEEHLKGLIAGVSKEINEMASRASTEGKHKQASVLRRISSRIQNAKNWDNDFGLAVVDLLDKFNCSDCKIVDDYYRNNPRIDGRYWAGTLSYYRGAAMHEGYFSIRDGKHEFYDIVMYINHMRDILIRIVLKILGFTGTYQPVVAKMTDRKTIDWVGLDTSATELGYGN